MIFIQANGQREMKKLITMVLFCVVLTGCAGTMQGVVRDSGKKIVFNYTQGMETDTLTTLIDEENFKGKAVMRNSSSFTGNAINSDGSNSVIFGNTTTGDIVAKLMGDKGSVLNCDLQYADSSGFTTSGGVGTCKHSDGRIIDVIW